MGKIININALLKSKEISDALECDEPFKEIRSMDSLQFRAFSYLHIRCMEMQIRLLCDYVIDLTRIVAGLRGEPISAEEHQKIKEYLEYDFNTMLDFMKLQSRGQIPGGQDDGDLS